METRSNWFCTRVGRKTTKIIGEVCLMIGLTFLAAQAWLAMEAYIDRPQIRKSVSTGQMTYVDMFSGEYRKISPEEVSKIQLYELVYVK